MATFTKQIKIGNETREVEFEEKGHGPMAAFHRAIEVEGAFRKRGGKIWFTRLHWVDDIKGGAGHLQRIETFLNSNDYPLVDFADNIKEYTSKHNSSNNR